MAQEDIAHHIQLISGAGKQECYQFASLFQTISLRKGQHIPIDVALDCAIFFLRTGQAHLCRTENPPLQSNTKNTLSIYQSSDLFILTTGESFSAYLEALSSCEISFATRDTLEEHLQKQPKNISIYQQLYAHHLRNTIKHLQLLQGTTALDRYHSLQRRFGQQLLLLPSQSLATYIGISRKHLSRLKLILLKNTR